MLNYYIIENLPCGANRGGAVAYQVLVASFKWGINRDPRKFGEPQLQAFSAGATFVPNYEGRAPRAHQPWVCIWSPEDHVGFALHSATDVIVVWPVAAKGEEDLRIHRMTSQQLAKLVGIMQLANSRSNRVVRPEPCIDHILNGTSIFGPSRDRVPVKAQFPALSARV